jgi:hypothetical protein
MVKKKADEFVAMGAWNPSFAEGARYEVRQNCRGRSLRSGLQVEKEESWDRNVRATAES